MGSNKLEDLFDPIEKRLSNSSQLEGVNHSECGLSLAARKPDQSYPHLNAIYVIAVITILGNIGMFRLICSTKKSRNQVKIFVEIMVVPKSNSDAEVINESEPENKKDKRKCFSYWGYGLAIGGICLAIGVALLIVFTNKGIGPLVPMNKGLFSTCTIFELFLSIINGL